jgi:hypothetical protein
VKSVECEKRLLLVAEMRVPGEAGLEFQITEIAPGRTEIKQIARFLPSGLLGLLYWFGISPLHEFVFSGMLNGVAEACKRPVIYKAKRVAADEADLKFREV